MAKIYLGYLAFSPRERSYHWLLGGSIAQLGLVQSHSAVTVQVQLDGKTIVQQCAVQVNCTGQLQSDAPVLLTPAETCSCSCLVWSGHQVSTSLMPDNSLNMIFQLVCNRITSACLRSYCIMPCTVLQCATCACITMCSHAQRDSCRHSDDVADQFIKLPCRGSGAFASMMPRRARHCKPS